MRPDPVSRELTVTELHPGISRDNVIKATGWDILFAETCGVTSLPSAHELEVLRDLERRTAVAHGVTGASE